MRSSLHLKKAMYSQTSVCYKIINYFKPKARLATKRDKQNPILQKSRYTLVYPARGIPATLPLCDMRQLLKAQGV